MFMLTLPPFLPGLLNPIEYVQVAGSLLLRTRLANLSFTEELPPFVINRAVGSEALGVFDAFEKLGFVEYTEVARRLLQQMVARWPGQPGHSLRCRQS